MTTYTLTLPLKITFDYEEYIPETSDLPATSEYFEITSAKLDNIDLTEYIGNQFWWSFEDDIERLIKSYKEDYDV